MFPWSWLRKMLTISHLFRYILFSWNPKNSLLVLHKNVHLRSSSLCLIVVELPEQCSMKPSTCAGQRMKNYMISRRELLMNLTSSLVELSASIIVCCSTERFQKKPISLHNRRNILLRNGNNFNNYWRVLSYISVK